MKKILVISKVNKKIMKLIRENASSLPETFNLVFKAGIPTEVPEVFAKALIKTYPQIYSKSNLSKEGAEKLVKIEEEKLLKAHKVEEDAKKKEAKKIVDPFKKDVNKETFGKAGQRYPIAKTDYTEDELGKLMNGELIDILKKNNGQEKLPVNTKKTELVELILKAQKG